MWRKIGLLCFGAVILVLASTAFAGQIIYVDADAVGANDGSSWEDAYNFLQDALAIAQAGDEIQVAEGIYKPDQGAGQTLGDREATFQLINGVALYGGFPPGGGSWQDRDPNNFETILSGDLNNNDVAVNNPEDMWLHPSRHDNSYHVVTGSGTNETAILDGFLITAGYNTGGGGGMWNWHGSPTVTNCTFIGNSAEWGGGIWNWDNSNPTLNNCTFTRNAAMGGGGMDNTENSNPSLNNCIFIGNVGAWVGGGMLNGYAGIGGSGSPTLINCKFTGNSTYGDGGGIYNTNNSCPTIINCAFSGNTAEQGGGMFNLDSSPILTNCTFSGNSAGDVGGGMSNESNSNPTLTNCTFSDNSARIGGAIGSWESSPTIADCNISGNSAGIGGGIEFGGGSCLITNCIITNNSATEHSGHLGYGGAIYCDFSNATITDCIISDNSADIGGGIGCSAYGLTILITNCTITGNSAELGGGAIFCDWGTSPTIADCAITDNSSGGGTIFCWDSSPTITNCIISRNSAVEGGAIYCQEDGNPTVTNCSITGNEATNAGGAIYNYGSSPVISNCEFNGNLAHFGGGIFNYVRCNPTLTNCTFAENSAPNGSALACDSDDHNYQSNIQITNCVFADGSNQIWNNDHSTITITYSDVQGGWPGEGNTDADPLFVEPGYWDAEDVWIEGDYRLQAGSPCIDAGDNSVVEPNSTDFAGNPRIIDGDEDGAAIVDMGAYEFVPAVEIEADLRVVPRVINLKSRGNYILAIMRLPEGIAEEDIDEDKGFTLEPGEIDAFRWRAAVDNGQVSVFAIFERKRLKDAVTETGEVELTVASYLTSGQRIYGVDTVRVIDPPREHPRKRAIRAVRRVRK